MKKIKLLLLFFLAALLLISCQKEKTASPDVIKQTNVSKLIFQKSGSGTNSTNQSPFVIHSAGVYQGTLYMSVSFIGGLKTHEFTMNWNGNLKTDGDKKEIDLVVYHANVNDQGTSTVYDSISANILPLGITTDELNDPLLWIRVTNSNYSENTFFFKASNEYIDPASITNTREVKVVNEGCSDYGIWGDLWLVTNDIGSNSHFFVMAIDNSITYTPVENDLLKIDFNYTYLTDSLAICTQRNQLNAQPIKITKITK
jgi:hypothetical protein